MKKRLKEEQRKEQERERRYQLHRERLLASLEQRQLKREDLERRSGYIISRPEHSTSHSPELPVISRLTQRSDNARTSSLPSECSGLLTTAYQTQQLLPGRKVHKGRREIRGIA